MLFVDTTAPVITITGDNPATVEFGASYSDDGATSSDALDGPVAVVTDVSGVNDGAIGSYSVTYTATDATLNAGVATRTVNVVGEYKYLLSRQSVIWIFVIIIFQYCSVY